MPSIDQSAPNPQLTEHYFSAEPAVEEHIRPLRVSICGQPVTLTTAAGVFSPDHIDAGTAELLRRVPPPPTVGNLLDLGCGWGSIALTLATESPGAEVYAVDVNLRALDLVHRNAVCLDLKNVHASLPEAVPADIQFDTIWSNPPIRIGKAALHSLLIDWLPRLTPDGEAWLVVQRNLGAESLTKWINNEFPIPMRAEKHSSAKGFQVLRVCHHQGAPAR